MFPSTKSLFALVACALVAQAQSNATATSSAASSSPTLDSCIISCASSAAASAGCVAYTNLTCTCTSSAFQQAALACLESTCTSSDLSTAEQLQSSECANYTSSATASVASSTGTTATSASSSSASASSTSNAALGLAAPFSFDTLLGTLLVSGGALVGAAFVL